MVARKLNGTPSVQTTPTTCSTQLNALNGPIRGSVAGRSKAHAWYKQNRMVLNVKNDVTRPNRPSMRQGPRKRHSSNVPGRRVDERGITPQFVQRASNPVTEAWQFQHRVGDARRSGLGLFFDFEPTTITMPSATP